jgi:hypothetical protein
MSTKESESVEATARENADARDRLELLAYKIGNAHVDDVGRIYDIAGDMFELLVLLNRRIEVLESRQ